MNIIITGVGGFIGSKLAQEFLRSGNSVYGVYRNSLPVLSHPNLVLLRNLEFDQLQINSKFDQIIDCAAEIPAKTIDQEELYNNNTRNTKILLKFASKYEIKKIIYMSSMSAYGNINCKIVTASTKDKIRDLYGQSKADSEDLIKTWCRNDLDRTAFVIRLPGIVGKYSHNNFISNLYKNIRNENLIKVFNRDSEFNNIVFINTLIEFISELSINNTAGYYKLLIASKSPMKVEAIVKKMISTLNVNPIVEWGVHGKPFLIDYSESEKFGFKAIDTEETISEFLLDVDKGI